MLCCIYPRFRYTFRYTFLGLLGALFSNHEACRCVVLVRLRHHLRSTSSTFSLPYPFFAVLASPAIILLAILSFLAPTGCKALPPLLWFGQADRQASGYLHSIQPCRCLSWPLDRVGETLFLQPFWPALRTSMLSSSRPRSSMHKVLPGCCPIK